METTLNQLVWLRAQLAEDDRDPARAADPDRIRRQTALMRDLVGIIQDDLSDDATDEQAQWMLRAFTAVYTGEPVESWWAS